MNLSKVAVALTILISNVAALGARPAATQAYLMLTKSDHIRTQLISKLGHTNRAVLKQRIKNAKMRAQLFNLLNQQQKPTLTTTPTTKTSSSSAAATTTVTKKTTVMTLHQREKA